MRLQRRRVWRLRLRTPENAFVEEARLVAVVQRMAASARRA